MEDLESAIYSLKETIEEQCSTKEYFLPGVSEDSIALTIRKMMKSQEKYIQELMECIDNLNETMENIVDIQKRALKWQEMSQ